MDIEEIKQSLEGAGLRCTAQRYAVMAFLMEPNNHPTAVEIFEAVNRVDPLSSKATTYNNLRDLVQAGLVREVAIEGRAARFDATGLRQPANRTALSEAEALAGRVADRVVVLQDGRIVVDAPPAEALTAALLAEVYGVDAEVTRDGAGLAIALHGRTKGAGARG